LLLFDNLINVRLLFLHKLQGKILLCSMVVNPEPADFDEPAG